MRSARPPDLARELTMRIRRCRPEDTLDLLGLGCVASDGMRVPLEPPAPWVTVGRVEHLVHGLRVLLQHRLTFRAQNVIAYSRRILRRRCILAQPHRDR